MTTPKMSAAAAKFWADQKAADEAYKKWEDQQWQENGQEWTKQGYTRTVDPNNAWGSTWTKSNQPVIETKTTPPPVDPIKPALVSKTAAQWDALAAEKSGGKYKTMDEVRALQQQLGIDPDGKWGSKTQAAYDAYLASQNTPAQITTPVNENPVDQAAWRNHMSGLGYTEVDRGDGTVHFIDGNGNTYFNNGHMSSGSQMGNYDYTTLTKLQSKTNPQYDKYTTNLLKAGKDAYRGIGELSQSFDSAFSRYLIDKYGKDTYNKYAMHGTWDKHEDYKPLWDLYKKQFNVDDTPLMNRPLFGYKKYTRKNKTGGTMNRINYFQQGGATPQQAAAQSEDEYLIDIVQRALQGEQQATQEVNGILDAAKRGDPTAQQQAQKISQIVEAIKQQQGQQGQQTPVKRYGSKLNYIRSLKYAKGGKTCSVCEQKVEMKKCGGKKAKKRYFGGYL